MKLFRIMIIVLFLILSMGIVSAQDNLNDTLQSDIPAGEEAGSFEELEYYINNVNNTLEITKDYRNDNYTKGINITRDNLIINGNNHTLDGNHKRIFNITASNVTINNLIFTNAFSSTGVGAIINEGVIFLNNVTFINNTAFNGAAIASFGGSVSLNNAVFIDNSANEFGGAIVIYYGELSVFNASFTSKISDDRGQIFSMGSSINIVNSTFANMETPYFPAAYIVSSDCSIVNSRFINLTADISAGAIAIKDGGNIYIADCEFINTTSSRNAGALNLDIVGLDSSNGNVSITNTLFKNAHSDFGGALIQLGGNLLLYNCEFRDNGATFRGGAVYLSIADVWITNCSFDSNVVEMPGDEKTYGGAIYCDMCGLTVNNSRFINNSAGFGNAVYARDSAYGILNSIFINNTNAVYTDFDAFGYLDNNTNDTGDTFSTNNTYFTQTIMTGEGMALQLVNDINVSNLPSRFDLRDWGWVPAVENQRTKGVCWAFASTDALESALRKAFGITTEFSVNNLADAVSIYSDFGVTEIYEAAGSLISVSYLVSWLGAFPQDYDPYDEVGKISKLITTDNKVHIQDVMFVFNDKPESLQMKTAILKFGAVSGSIHTFEDSSYAEPYFNNKTNAQYINESISSDHAISVVGWDDNYPKENFLITPPGDGAWICKNSYGEDWGDGGYFYVSYYDKSFFTSYKGEGDSLTANYQFESAIILENTVAYNKNYQHELLWNLNFYSYENVSYANVFEALDDDLIAAVGTYFRNPDEYYKIDIYVNGELKLTQEGTSPFGGFHTIKLNEYISLKAGDTFSAVMTSDVMPLVVMATNRIHSTPGLSYFCRDGEWNDLYDEGLIACLKVYTVADDSKIIENEDMTVDYAGGKCFSVKAVTADGHAVVGGDVNFTINGKTITVKTDSEGMAKLEITELPGVYVMTTSFNGQTYRNNVSVKLNQKTCKITANKNINVDYAGGKYFTVKVVSADSKVAASGVYVKFTINGKTTTVKTDKNGIAKIKITQNPGKYAIKTTFNGKTCTNKVTVKHVLTASKIAVKKTAGKFTLKAKLKINGKLVKGKWITFKFNGKTYRVKTNSKGIAQKTLNKNVIKKLRKGKTYTVKVTYLKDTIKSGVKVR